MSASPRTERAVDAPRMSRAAWLAIASSVAAFAALANACSGKVQDDTSALDADAGADAGDARPVGPTCAAPEAGTFACGQTRCEYGKTYCDRTVAGACVDGVSRSTVSGTCYAWYRPTTTPCTPCPTCECLMRFETAGTSCTGEGGSVVITRYQTVTCGGPCYGAPPARLARLAATATIPATRPGSGRRSG